LKIANTSAGLAYQTISASLDWSVASDAEQLVVLEELVDALSKFKKTDAVFDRGIDEATGERAFESVADVLLMVAARQRSKSATMLASVGGKVSSKMREVLLAGMRRASR
jgi:hypothetical protein